MFILYEDSDLLIIDKPPGLLTIATEKERERTAYRALMDYVRKGAPKSRNRVFIVHRLDREASGVLVFAKSEPVKRVLQANWDAVEKKYLAVVHGQLPKKADTLSSYLTESKARVVHSTRDKTAGKLSHTAYRVLEQTPAFSLLEITLLTGRKHQIRVHLAEARHPIVGDQKYGPADKAHKRLALHALSLSFAHPVSGKTIKVQTDIPGYLTAVMGQGHQVLARKHPDRPPKLHSFRCGKP
ncbi:MAG: RluA family pseudouridine synthase [Candidatus Hydrogenedentes bacterium]|nr:RluA family pseudouridine synthase [Candidatus Hydrogenedentota bacterium]MBI3119631.1 RluA family pseudouridine synthase [Candidatus Hydrogenedentota bacterium]